MCSMFMREGIVETQVWSCTYVIPMLQKQAKVGGSLGRLASELQISEPPCLKERLTPEVVFWAPAHAFTGTNIKKIGKGTR